MRSVCLVGLLRRAHRSAVAVFDRHNDGGVSQPQYEILSALLTHGPMTQTGITRVAAVDRSSLSMILQFLSGQNLISKCRHEKDQRSVLVTITPAGRDALRRTERALDEAERAVRRVIGPHVRDLAGALIAISEIAPND